VSAASTAAFVADQSNVLEERLDAYQRWLESRRFPPDEQMVSVICDAMDAIRFELARRAAAPLQPVPDGPRVREIGALDAWRDEVRRGVNGQRADKPSTWKLGRRGATGLHEVDPLVKAACREADGREFDRMGLYALADACRTDAARILADNAKDDAA
jgi:hypothetical protein